MIYKDRYWALVFKARFNLRLILQQQQQNKILFQEFMDRSTQSEDTAQGGQYTHGTDKRNAG
ncbi:predicted protein [Plenodomus lingam JN3]|uniref:Predicted protein n=1 Tax=Leptosphaeria maculans (strain JN3 / isolate v23.1.3 / race Av1-4-5-6-7-8) TaxID=985895 RepID=E4ZJS3_LEPMJ|nr:predicted protein [Plenodomus lingam JN3]CBX91358.1 predicted protein [Plenodomus lingam JN3]